MKTYTWKMRINAWAIALWLVLLATWAGADLAPQQNYSTDCSKMVKQQNLTFVQASSQKLGWTLYESGTNAKNVSGSSVLFSYVPTDRSWIVPVVGSVVNGSNGTVLVSFTPANLNTNSGASSFDFILRVYDATQTLAIVKGQLTIAENIDSTAAPLTIYTGLDWARFVGGFTNTAASGPYRAGTNVLFSANADGSVNVNVNASGGTQTNQPTPPLSAVLAAGANANGTATYGWNSMTFSNGGVLAGMLVIAASGGDRTMQWRDPDGVAGLVIGNMGLGGQYRYLSGTNGVKIDFRNGVIGVGSIKGAVSAVAINGVTNSPDGAGMVDLGTVAGTADTLQDVVNRGGTVTSNAVTIDAANAATNTMGGLLTVLGRNVKSGIAVTSSGDGSLASGYANSSGSIQSTSRGSFAGGYVDLSIETNMASHYGTLAYGRNVRATLASAIALGKNANATNLLSFVWSDGTGTTLDSYGSHGDQSFNINPRGGFWIGNYLVGDTNGLLYSGGNVVLTNVPAQTNQPTPPLSAVLAAGNAAGGTNITGLSRITMANGGSIWGPTVPFLGTTILTDPNDRTVLEWDETTRELAGTNNVRIAFPLGKIDRASLTDVASAAQGAKADNAITNNYVGNVTIAGTVAGSNGIATNEFVTVAQWQEGLSGNVDIYASSTKLTNYPPTNAMYICTDAGAIVPQLLLTNVCSTNNDYIFGWGCTNTLYTVVPAQTVAGVIYIGENMARTLIGKVEIYRIEPSTGNIYEWGNGGATFTVTGGSAVPTRVPFEAGVAAVSTNIPFNVFVRFKRTSGTANTGDVFFVGVGTNYQTHLTFSVQSSLLLAPYATKADLNNVSNYLATATSRTPYIIPMAASNVISLANGDVQHLDLTGYQATTLYLPNSPSNQSHQLTMCVNPSTNALTVSTFGISHVRLSTNPAFSTAASKMTVLEFYKCYNSTSWYGWSMFP